MGVIKHKGIPLGSYLESLERRIKALENKPEPKKEKVKKK